MSNTTQHKHCPYIPVCVTPNWYIYEKASFVKNVCQTKEHTKCTSYSGFVSNIELKDKKEWERVRNYILNHSLYIERDPSRRY